MLRGRCNLVCYQYPSGRSAWAFSRLGSTPESAQDTFLRVENGLDIDIIDIDGLSTTYSRSNSDDVKAPWRGSPHDSSAAEVRKQVVYSLGKELDPCGEKWGRRLSRQSPAKVLLLKRLIQSRYFG